MNAFTHSRRIILVAVCLVAAMACLAATVNASPAATGRWKIDGPNCYWDANDEGADQCDPNNPPGGYTYDSNGYCNFASNVFSNVCTPTGRYKTNRVTCWWVATESGPNQCDPNAPPGGYAIDSNGYCNRLSTMFGDTCAPTGQYRTDGTRCWWAEEYSGPNQCDPGNLPRPTITLTAPVSGVVIDAPVNSTLAATASSSPGWVLGVEFYANGVLVGVDTTEPYTSTWPGPAVGSYAITARAVNSYGMATWSASASVTVSPGVEYYHLDALGSVRATTDKTGAVASRFEYFPFGESDSPASGADPLRFTGQEGDSESGLLYFGARYYRAWTGRFTTSDPLLGTVFNPQGWNRYSYALNSPTTFTDPNGLVSTNCRAGIMFCDTVTGHPGGGGLPPAFGTSGTNLGGSGGGGVGGVRPDPATARGSGGRGRGTDDRKQTPNSGPPDPEPPNPPPADEPPPVDGGGGSGGIAPLPASPLKIAAQGSLTTLTTLFSSQFKQSCLFVFGSNTAYEMNPVDPSMVDAVGNGLALWQFNGALAYAASRPNVAGGQGLLFPFKSGAFRNMLGRSLLTVKVLPAANLAYAMFVKAIPAEIAAWQSGECR